VVPYVHERGARVPSLRRVYKRFPLFTSGAAPDLPAVLSAARVAGEGTSTSLFMHAGVGDGLAAGLHGFPPADQSALLSFLTLL